MQAPPAPAPASDGVAKWSAMLARHLTPPVGGYRARGPTAYVRLDTAALGGLLAGAGCDLSLVHPNGIAFVRGGRPFLATVLRRRGRFLGYILRDRPRQGIVAKSGVVVFVPARATGQAVARAVGVLTNPPAEGGRPAMDAAWVARGLGGAAVCVGHHAAAGCYEFFARPRSLQDTFGSAPRFFYQLHPVITPDGRPRCWLLCSFELAWAPHLPWTEDLRWYDELLSRQYVCVVNPTYTRIDLCRPPSWAEAGLDRAVDLRQVRDCIREW